MFPWYGFAGFQTSIRNHEKQPMLCVEITHKVLRLDNVLKVIKAIRDTARYDNLHDALVNDLKDAIVMTHYNRKTYKILDVNLKLNPGATFLYGRPDDQKEISFADYYKTKYDLTVSDMKQPLLLAKPSKKAGRQPIAGDCLLIPEFCQMTGLTDQMRANFTLMKELSKHLHTTPAVRTMAIQKFMDRLRSTQTVRKLPFSIYLVGWFVVVGCWFPY